MKPFFVILSLCWGSFLLLAQSYVPLDTADYMARKSALKLLDNKRENFSDRLKESYKGKLRKSLQYSYLEFNDDFKESVKKGDFVFDEDLKKYFQNIVTEITSHNTPNVENLSLFISKNPMLNAYCTVDGMVIANLGLLYWMENEDQIAGILSHEIAHKLLEHSLKAQVSYVNESVSKETKKEIRDLKRKRYGRQKEAFDIFKSRLYETSAEQRQREMEADSLGYLLLKNTRYKTNEYIYALNLMMVYDTIKPAGVKPAIYKKYFDLPEQPFNENWLQLEDFSDYDYSQYETKLDEEKLSSHPKSQERIVYLQSIFPELKKDTIRDMAENEEFTKWSNIAMHEQVPAYYQMEEYGKGLYLTLLRLQQEKDNDYYKKWLGTFLNKIVEGRKNYTLNRYVERVEPEEQTPSYQLFLNFIWNLNLTELENMADYYSHL